MRDMIMDFLRRGVTACGIGPLVLVVLYMVFKHNGVVESLTVNEVAVGILSLSALAFIAGGMNFVYRVERLPLVAAILIHGVVLYVSYLLTYLVNGWIEKSFVPIAVFTAIFIGGFVAIWVVIYMVMRARTKSLNEKLRAKQESEYGI